MYIAPETWNFIREHQHDDVHSLLLQLAKYPDVDMKAAVTQISGRQAIAAKIPSWYNNEKLIFPQHLPLEQCSSEATAQYKAGLCSGNTFVDLTGGFGVDFAFMSTKFSQAIYIERQKELCEIAQNNFPQLGLHNVRVINEDGVNYLQTMEKVDCIFIDPARRDKHGKKTVRLSNCEPDVAQIEDLLLDKADKVIIKLSPMLDISLAARDLKYTSAVHVLSVNNDCKELLFVLDKTTNPSINLHCINITHGKPQEFIFTKEEEQNASTTFANEVDKFLYEPNASILKAGAYKSIGVKYNLKKLHSNSHLYTGEECIEEFPGRIFRVEDYASLKDKNLLRGIDKANISTRNFPLSVAELRKRFKLKEGGDVYLFATTLQNNAKILIRCTKFASK
jgi:Precorrin-6B methylase 2